MFNTHTLCFLATKRLCKITLLWVMWAFRSEAAGTSRHVLSCLSPVTFDLKSQTHFSWSVWSVVFVVTYPECISTEGASLFIFGHVSHNVSKDVRDRVLLPESNFRCLEMLSACRSATAQIRRPRQQSMLGISEALIAVINHIYCLSLWPLEPLLFSFSLFLPCLFFLFSLSFKCSQKNPWGLAEVVCFSP